MKLLKCFIYLCLLSAFYFKLDLKKNTPMSESLASGDTENYEIGEKKIVTKVKDYKLHEHDSTIEPPPQNINQTKIDEINEKIRKKIIKERFKKKIIKERMNSNCHQKNYKILIEESRKENSARIANSTIPLPEPVPLSSKMFFYSFNLIITYFILILF
jgi:hypothetical protein